MCAVLVSDDVREWPDGPRLPPPPDNDSVHVWRADLEQSPELIRAHLASLSTDERQRADRYRFDRDRLHFIAARGVLRDLVGRYVGCPPAGVSFSYGRYGKPGLVGAAGAARLAFNVSHSHGVALYAFTRGAEVGLDVEFIREDVACLEVAERTFSPDEVAALRALPAESRVAAFFDCWVRKEAYVKARGEGLSHDLRGFTVSLAPGATTALLATSDGPSEAMRWSLSELPVGKGYAGALAVRLTMPRTTLLKWRGL
jgi:4'-phosphopantetheinyl transferase